MEKVEIEFLKWIKNNNVFNRNDKTSFWDHVYVSNKIHHSCIIVFLGTCFEHERFETNKNN